MEWPACCTETYRTRFSRNGICKHDYGLIVHGNTYHGVFCYHRHPGMLLNESRALRDCNSNRRTGIQSFHNTIVIDSVQYSRFVLKVIS